MLAFAVNGTLMRGLERNANLVEAGGVFDREARTAPCYRLWSIGDVHPAMLRVESGGRSIAVEIWLVPHAGVAAILLTEPDGLCVGRVTLEDGTEVLGVLAEPALVEGRREITRHGGWRAYALGAFPYTSVEQRAPSGVGQLEHPCQCEPDALADDEGAALDVGAHERGRGVGVAGKDAGEDLEVLGDRRADAAVGREVVDPQHADAVVEVAE